MDTYLKKEMGVCAKVHYAFWENGEWKIVLVRDPRFKRQGLKAFWKPPGGTLDREKGDTTDRDAASRELTEEAGPIVAPDKLVAVSSEERVSRKTGDPYIEALFSHLDLSRPGTLKSWGDEGEEVGVFRRKELEEMIVWEDILPVNLNSLIEFLKSLPERPLI
ncbi:NUDIX domain-containing protein [Candidatus Kaiserbacteria bacterium]|nr:NUDIX domain-containing protein [Candidatus Kaiserbacteria bacterium]